MKSLLAMVKHRINQSKTTSLFFMFGMVISMLLLSIGISFTYEHIYAARNKEKMSPPNGTVYGFDIPLEADVKLDTSSVNKLLEGIRSDTGVIFNNMNVNIDRSSINSYISVSAEWFSEDDNWHYPVSKGRYYTAEEVKNGDKVVAIGCMLEEYTFKENGKEYIKMYGEKYEVVGVVGFNNQVSLWDNRVFVPATSLPEKMSNSYSLDFVGMILYNEDPDFSSDIDVITKNVNKMGNKIKVKYEGEIETENMMQLLIQSSNDIYVLAFIGYFATLIYSINIVILWVEKRRFEIGVRKAFGYTDKDIAKMIFQELFGMTLVSAVISIVIQELLSLIFNKIGDYTFKIYLSNIIISIVLVLLTALITSIIPIIKALKIPPANTLKEGEIV
ncbi:MAG: ABC transporter permease [Agathobacter sp.]|nr:ABC transporter permease [Agathobacter sp.]